MTREPRAPEGPKAGVAGRSLSRRATDQAGLPSRGSRTFTVAFVGAGMIGTAFAVWFAAGWGSLELRATASAFAQLAAALAATVCSGIAARRTRAPWRLGWALAALSTGFVLVGALISTWYQLTKGVTPVFPSIADFGFIAGYLFAIAACLAYLSAGGLAGIRTVVALELLMVTAGLLCFSWETVLDPLLRLHPGAGLERFFPTVYPFGDIVVGAFLVSLLVRSPRAMRMPFQLYAAGMASIAVWDSSGAWAQATGTYVAGTFAEAVVVIGYLFLACAGLWAATHTDVFVRSAAASPSWQLRIAYIPVVLGTAAAVVHAYTSSHAIDPVLFGIVIALFGLMVLRQFLLLRDYVGTVNRLAQRERELRHLALHDGLTGLANRKLFQEVVAEKVGATAAGGGTCAVLFIDLDDFKRVNDSKGHQAGDQVLVTVAQRLATAIRATDLAARIGGDEFAVLLLPIADEVEAKCVADRIIVELEGGAGGECIRASIGIAVTAEPTLDAAEILRRADVAMYAAKSRGKAHAVLYSSDLETVERRSRSGLEQAPAARRFIVRYHPDAHPETLAPIRS